MFFDDKTSRIPRSHTASVRGTEQQDASDRPRRRTPRACDMCRLKKVKCEGGHPSRKACTNCIMNSYDCTYLQMARHELRDKAYVQNLEMRLAKMEELVQKWCPDNDVSQELLKVQVAPPTARASPSPSVISSSPQVPGSPSVLDDNDFDSDEDEASARQTVSDYLTGTFNTPAPSLVGKSSAFMLIRSVLDYKDVENDKEHSHMTGITQTNATPFWESHTWDSRPSGPRHQFTFPSDDLLRTLVDNYFKGGNVYSPLLHRPTFERNISRGLHLSDEGFGATVLLVCALGSRQSEDPRVFCPDDELGHLSGGHWFNQVMKTMNTVMFDSPRLYDLQIAWLASCYMTRTANPQMSCWLIVGHGIKMALVIGAHRRKIYSDVPIVERELLKRAFWCLVKTDRELSYYLGRPCAIQDEDFDVDLPLECDDEYWTSEDPKQAFKQPEGTHSSITAFNWGLKLSQIQSYAMRTIYSITKAKVALGHVGPHWEERTVMELDSALNQWLDSLPGHLRWNPKEKDYAILARAAALNADFYNLQLIVHRPFITLRRQKVATFPSLAICTNAARSALRILDVQYMRAAEEGKQGLGVIGTISVAAMILLLNILNEKRAGSTANVMTDVELVSKAVYMLMSFGPLSTAIKLASNSLIELMRIGRLPLPQESNSPYVPRDARSQETVEPDPWRRPETNTHPSETTTPAPAPDLALPAAGTWNPSPYAGELAQGSFSGNAGGGMAQAGNTVDDFLRTLDDLSARGAPPNMGPIPYEWPVNTGDEGGIPNYGFQWEEWGSLFANAFGVERPASDGSGGGGGSWQGQ